MADIDFAEKFERLARRFFRIDADNDADGARYLKHVKAFAATTVKQCCDAGVLEFGDIGWPAPVAGFDDQLNEVKMAGLWDGLCLWLAQERQDELPKNILVMDDGFGSHKDWRQRAENGAEVCRWLAEQLSKAADVTSPAGGPTADGRFQWEEKKTELTKTEYRFADAVWRYATWEDRNGRASTSDVVCDAWGTEDAESTRLPSMISRLNDKLTEVEIPVTFSKRGDFITISWSL